jgi:hypothetical protein
VRRSINSLAVALICFAIGGGLVILSHLIGILNYEVCWQAAGGDWAASRLVSCLGPHDLRKQVGFGLALNWSVGLTVLFPLFIYCVCETANSGRWAIEQMYERRMIVTLKLTRPPKKQIDSLIRRRTVTLAVATGVVALLTLAFVPFEYGVVVGKYYSSPEQVTMFPLTDQEREADWSIAAPICQQVQATTGTCERVSGAFALNGMFSAAVHSYLVFFGAVTAIGFMLAFGIYIRFFFSAELRDTGIQIVPDPGSNDRRRGFEILEPFFVYAVAGCFVLFAMGYLVTLQNVYLRTQAGSILQLVVPLLPDANDLSLAGILGALQTALSEQLTVVNGNSVAVTILGLLFFLIMVTASATALGSTARRGRDLVKEMLEGSDEDRKKLDYVLNGTPVATANTAMIEIDFWPMRWPRLNAILAWMVLALLSLAFVTVGFYLICLGLLFVIRQAVRK